MHLSLYFTWSVPSLRWHSILITVTYLSNYYYVTAVYIFFCHWFSGGVVLLLLMILCLMLIFMLSLILVIFLILLVFLSFGVLFLMLVWSRLLLILIFYAFVSCVTSFSTVVVSTSRLSFMMCHLCVTSVWFINCLVSISDFASIFLLFCTSHLFCVT